MAKGAVLARGVNRARNGRKKNNYSRFVGGWYNISPEQYMICPSSWCVAADDREEAEAMGRRRVELKLHKVKGYDSTYRGGWETRYKDCGPDDPAVA